MMPRTKKVLTYALGATMIAGAAAYLASPESTKHKIKNMIGDMTKKMGMDMDSTSAK